MAMDKTRLGNKLADAVESFGATLGPLDKLNLKAIMQSFAEEIIDEITGNAEVSTNVTTTGVTGAGSPGGPLPIVSQPGTGTGTIV